MPTLNARSQRTRESIFAAAREILENDGFEALTIAAVADRAGVTRRAVYLHFASRAEIVGALFDEVAESEGLAESTARVWAAPDAGVALEEWAAHLARYHPRVLAVDRAVERVAAFVARLARVVELRFFGGLSVDEVARALEISPRTVAADWTLARAWLYRALSHDHAE
jgi:AcrR family transcriptional regulator